jgi:hypothetical protein
MWIPGEASNPPRSHFSVPACSSEGLDLVTPNLWLGKASLPGVGLRLLHGAFQQKLCPLLVPLGHTPSATTEAHYLTPDAG